MANDAHEEFWGCTLSGSKKEYLWDPATDSEEDVEHKLQLTTACLGHKAKDGERNVVEVTTEDDDGKKVTCPVVSLKVGGAECMHIDLGLYNTTKFVLKEGSGPLSLCGVHLKALPLDFDEDEESSEDEEVPDIVSPVPAKKGGKNADKRKEEMQNNVASVGKDKIQQQKMGKRQLSDTNDELPSKKKKPTIEDSEEENEDESDEEEMPSLLDNEAEEGDSDEDSEEGDDEPDEGDDIDSEEEDEDDENDDNESNEEEVEELIKPKKQVNGQAKENPKKDSKKATPKDNDKTPGKKASAKQENTQTPKSQAKKTPEEIKAFLLKSPNLPKKFDKFSNFMKNNMKVVDEKSQKELWDYVQKNKK